jgi:hypothetical protein
MSANPMFEAATDMLDRFIEDLERNPPRPRKRQWNDLSESEQRRTFEHYLLYHMEDAETFVREILMEIDIPKLIENIADDDRMENGRLIEKLLMPRVGAFIEKDERYCL